MVRFLQKGAQLALEAQPLLRGQAQIVGFVGAVRFFETVELGDGNGPHTTIIRDWLGEEGQGPDTPT
jgi:hypothetical protein